MGVSACRSLRTAGRSKLISSYIRSTGHRFASTTLVAGHHSANPRLDAGHGSRGSTWTHRGALTNGLHGRGAAMLACLLKTCIGRAGDGFAGAGLITGHTLGATGAGATHHLIAVGDAEANLGSFGFGVTTAELIDLLGADVLITRNAMAGTELIAGDGGGTTHQGAGNAGPRQGC